MRGLRFNIRAILAVFVTLFVTLFVYLGYTVMVNGTRWFVSPYNPRLTKQSQNVIAGSILDRNGEVLAYSEEDGTRRYISNATTRLALCHAIGDPYGIAASGMESFHAKYLLGFQGNVVERVYQAVTLEKRHGDDIKSTLDASLSTYAYEQMGSYNGACVVMNYKTGEILASVSKPGFDLTSIKDFDAKNAKGSELVNRVTMGKYTPGSVFKTVTAAAVIQEKPQLLERTYTCTGKREYPTGTVTCYKNAVHGKQTFAQAYMNSCNCAFAEIADELGRTAILKTAERFGFNNDFVFSELNMNQSSYEPAAKDSELNFVWSAVGQYKDIVTPLHMCMISAAVANDGTMMEPKMLNSVLNSLGMAYKNISPKKYKDIMDSSDAATLRAMMIQTVESGTGTGAQVSGKQVGGKTGTAEVSNDKNVKPHSWFTGFVYDDESPLAIAIVLENAGSGSSAATPAAGKILRKAVELGY